MKEIKDAEIPGTPANKRLPAGFVKTDPSGRSFNALVYFDVWEIDRLDRDDIGLELGSLEAAEREAIIAAAGIGHERLPKGCSETGVQVRDEYGQTVFTVAVSMIVRRMACVHA
jgi:hypothetical protein